MQIPFGRAEGCQRSANQPWRAPGLIQVNASAFSNTYTVGL